MDKAKIDVERIKKEWSSFWRRSYRFTRCRLSGLFLFVMACCVVVTALIWYFALFDDLQVRILMSLGYCLDPDVRFPAPTENMGVEGGTPLALVIWCAYCAVSGGR